MVIFTWSVMWFSCPQPLLSPWVRIKWTWCARSTMTLLCFFLQWLIWRVLLCGSCHFTHGYVKPVGGCSPAAVRVCVSMHDCVLKYWSVLSSTMGSPRRDSCPLILFFFSSLSQWCGFIFYGMACKIRKATSSGPMTELIHRSCRMKRPFGVNPFQRPQWKASLRCWCPLQPWQC